MLPMEITRCLVSTCTKNELENHHDIIGKSTISTGPFSSSQTVNVYLRVFIFIRMLIME